jgi:hypothetical protein
MITHAGARTRAVYKWEDDLLLLRSAGGNQKVKSVGQAQLIVNRIWDREGMRSKPPKVVIKDHKGYPNYCDGVITLTDSNRWVLTLVHEVAHATGVGPSFNHHSKAFVKKFINLLAFQFGWNQYDLTCDAMKRKLL